MRARLKILGLVMVPIALVAPGVVSAERGGECKKVDARGVGQDLGGGDTEATITNDGLLKGSTTAHFDIVGGAAPRFEIAGRVTDTTHKGTLTIGVAGTFDVSTGHFTASGPVTGGSGKFLGSTGTLTFDGTQLPTGAFTETVTGTVCLDKGHDG